MFLKKFRIVSNASRNLKKLTSIWFDKTPFKSLLWRKLSNAGRNHSGRIVVWTKSSLKNKLLHPRINYSMRSRVLALVTTFKLIPLQNKLVALSFLASGGISYLPATDHFKIFGFTYFPTQNSKLKVSLVTPLCFYWFTSND